ncbi:hypothetical protein DWV84_24155 [Blautia sp. AF13-16]|uniref:hypothetical protein n=1 Tax=Blautia sp. AF13-16 TaxID=2292195 RepID=UPI000E504C53|nr:hypothetical protein [Blautia sp. AF13-16]RHS11237.1 hypothetical protein DWV84_24155 [Blautia sp. AF13-16]
MEKLKSDGDVMIHLRNIARELRELSKMTGQTISMDCRSEKDANVRIGDYAIIILGDKEYYRYEPIRGLAEWRDIEPQQAVFGSAPNDDAGEEF